MEGFIARDFYDTYYQYRKTIKAFRDAGYVVCRVYGGMGIFNTEADYNRWTKQMKYELKKLYLASIEKHLKGKEK